MKGRDYRDGGQHDLSWDERRIELSDPGYRFGRFCWSSVPKHLTQRKAEQRKGPQRQSVRGSNRGPERPSLLRSFSSADELTTARRPHFSLWPLLILAFFSVLKFFFGKNEHGRLQSVQSVPKSEAHARYADAVNGRALIAPSPALAAPYAFQAERRRRPEARRTAQMR
jgi:hypothetical protein